MSHFNLRLRKHLIAKQFKKRIIKKQGKFDRGEYWHVLIYLYYLYVQIMVYICVDNICVMSLNVDQIQSEIDNTAIVSSRSYNTGQF